jgi:GNAT superfamily N-acetyltransferase
VNELRVRPVTRDTWPDFVRLFEAKGGPHYCFCTPYRLKDAAHLANAQKKARMKKLVDAETPVGVLAYDGDEPVGWCSIAPRETYLRLERSRTMPRATPPGTPTWTVLCFFVARPARQMGVTRALLDGAVKYARAAGARAIEGYPFDTAGISATHRGHSSIFEAARFRRDGKRWSRELAGR